ncbi:MAG: flagellar hook-basal body complex protein FliE [Vampirovibrionales bacterium]|nr:flagellar hook-basal body complex protein FliE [Vampirovibrionales bacterium]
MVNILNSAQAQESAVWAPIFQNGQLPEHAVLTARIQNEPAQQATHLTNHGPGQLFESFGDTLGKAMDGVNTIQNEANQQAEAYATGQQTELHQVIMAVGKAETAMQLTVQIRNKMIDAYHEITRMQV